MLSHLLFSLLLPNISIRSVGAFPIQNASINSSSPSTSLAYFDAQPSAADSSPLCSCNQRSTLDIVWGCIATLILCTWVAVHPNVPAPNEEAWKILWRRLKAMYWTIAAPELIVAWAARQYFGARIIFAKYKDRGWTMQHAHFLQMGGFYLCDGQNNEVVLDPKTFDVFISSNELTFPNTTKEDIQDKSKADSLSKTMLLIQTLWFVVQCIGRHFQGLALAPLEVTTLAVTICTFILFIIWWDKPLDVRQPIRLYVNPKGACGTSNEETKVDASLTSESMVAVEDEDGSLSRHQTKEYTAVKQQKIHQLTQFVLYPFRELYHVLHSIAKTSRNAIAESLQDYGRLITFLMVIFRWPTTGQMFKIVFSYEVPTGDRKRVPSYFAAYPERISRTPKEWLKMCAIPVVCATIFGLVHCIAWNSHFPSIAERKLWQSSAIAVATILHFYTALNVFAVRVLAVNVLDAYIPQDECRFTPRISILQFGIVINWAILLIYLTARYYLLVEAVISFRHLPPSAREDVEWSNFIPHI